MRTSIVPKIATNQQRKAFEKFVLTKTDSLKSWWVEDAWITWQAAQEAQVMEIERLRSERVVADEAYLAAYAGKVALHAENEALRIEASKLECDYTDQVLRAMKAEEELEALRADAVRIDWMDATCADGGTGMRLDYKVGGLRTAIDAAMNQGKNHAE